jgi:hypothetical protein
MRYPLHTKNYADSMLPIIIGGDIKVSKYIIKKINKKHK